MSANGKYTFRKILVAMAWVLLSSGTVVLLIAAISRKNNEHCARIEIDITGVQNNFFIDKRDVLDILQKTNGGRLEMKPLHSMDLALMEIELQKTQWIKNAELFFDNNNVLEVKITEREPIARVFTFSGLSFYMDSSLVRLPLSDKFSARLPVFTNFPTDVIVLSKADSDLIRDIRTISEFIGTDPFWMAEIDQVDISPGRTFDFIPKLGNHVIHFGKAENYQEKFNNLLCFYRQVLSKKGWSQYSSVDVQFTGQIIGVRRGAVEIKMDSLRSVQIMKAIIADAQKHINDTTNIQLEQPEDNSNINTSSEIENIPDEDVKGNINATNKNRVSVAPIHVPEKPFFENHPAVKRNVATNHPSSVGKSNPAPVKNQVIKPPVSKPLQNIKEKPKAVMPPKTDY
jgi:cell division protein FtsQ